MDENSSILIAADGDMETEASQNFTSPSPPAEAILTAHGNECQRMMRRRVMMGNI